MLRAKRTAAMKKTVVRKKTINPKGTGPSHRTWFWLAINILNLAVSPS